MQEFDEYKHPDSDLDYGINWGDNPETGEKGWLNPEESVIFSEWVISSKEEDPVTLEEGEQSTSISSEGKMTSIFLIGGKTGIQYILANTIRTTDSNGVNRKETKEVLLNCKRGC